MTRRIIEYFVYIGSIFSLALIIYGVTGPYYNIKPLKSHFSFATKDPQIFEFEVEKSEKYMVEIHLKHNIPSDQLNSILGNGVKNEEDGQINIEWFLHEGDKILGSNSNIDYGHSSIFSRDYSGLSIGEITVQKGKYYSLYLYVKSINPDWDVTEPIIEVRLHPAKLEYLIVYFICGVFLLLIFGPMMFYLVHKKRRKITNI